MCLTLLPSELPTTSLLQLFPFIYFYAYYCIEASDCNILIIAWKFEWLPDRWTAALCDKTSKDHELNCAPLLGDRASDTCGLRLAVCLTHFFTMGSRLVLHGTFCWSATCVSAKATKFSAMVVWSEHLEFCLEIQIISGQINVNRWPEGSEQKVARGCGLVFTWLVCCSPTCSSFSSCVVSPLLWETRWNLECSVGKITLRQN
jgi:hypothetical protein